MCGHLCPAKAGPEPDQHPSPHPSRQRGDEASALVFPPGFPLGKKFIFPGQEACPELSTLDSLFSANSYCEVNVERSGQFYV